MNPTEAITLEEDPQRQTNIGNNPSYLWFRTSPDLPSPFLPPTPQSVPAPQIR
jgi:hypothetical protein